MQKNQKKINNQIKITYSCIMEKGQFTVEAIVSCDDRGQLVLPKDLRKKLNISAGEKLALMKIMDKNDAFFLTLIKADALGGLIKNYMTPVMKEVIK